MRLLVNEVLRRWARPKIAREQLSLSEVSILNPGERTQAVRTCGACDQLGILEKRVRFPVGRVSPPGSDFPIPVGSLKPLKIVKELKMVI